MKWIGLTGGIAAGKSTVTKMLRTLGYEVLDADEFSRQVTGVGGEALPEIFSTFGEAVKNQDGSLNREFLARLVFGHEELLRRLEAIIHPLVQKRVFASKAELEHRGIQVVFYDVPLLFEEKMQGDFDAIVLVYCREDQQIKRLMDRSVLSQAEAEMRVRSQLPLQVKKDQTPFVIDNTSDFKHLEEEVRRVLHVMKI